MSSLALTEESCLPGTFELKQGVVVTKEKLKLKNGLFAVLYTSFKAFAVVEEVLRSFAFVKVVIPQCRNTVTL